MSSSDPGSSPAPTTRAPSSWSVRAGALAWVVSTTQFFACHLVVQSAWPRPYSWSRNAISDLGNVRCGPWGDDGRYVCSPLHAVTDASFVLTGVLVLAGLLLTRGAWPPGRARAGRVLLAVSATGYLTAGLVPADVDEDVHVLLGAVPLFLAGNLGLLLTGLGRGPVPPGVRAGALACGAVGLTGVGLLATGHDLGLGTGGMERVVAFPELAWVLVAGLLLARSTTRGVTPRRGRPSGDRAAPAPGAARRSLPGTPR